MENKRQKIYTILLFASMVLSILLFAYYKITTKDHSIATTTPMTLNIALIIGVLFGIVKFSAKVSIGCSLARFNTLERMLVSSIYVFIPVAIAFIVEVIGMAVLNNIENANNLITISQAAVSILFLILGIYTVKKWTSTHKDHTKRNSLFMVFPCPGTLLTMLTTTSLLVIAGVDSLLVSLFIGGTFLLFIWLGDILIKKLHMKRDPSQFGAAMIFFGILYIFSVVFVPAYTPVSEMDMAISTTFGLDSLIVCLFMGGFILGGFLLSKFNIKKNKTRN